MKYSINIQKDNIDPNYRYKMPQIIGKMEGRGNGKKTVIVNINDVAKSLNRDPNEILKFIGYSIHTQTKIDKNCDKMVVNGLIMNDKLQDIVYDYIDRFVICPKCDNPETYYMFKLKKEKVYRKCEACGAKKKIKDEKLNKFLLKKELNSEKPIPPPQPLVPILVPIRNNFKK